MVYWDTHSDIRFPKTYFNQKFEAEKIDAQYVNFEIPNIKEIKNVLKENPGIEWSECNDSLQRTGHSLSGRTG